MQGDGLARSTQRLMQMLRPETVGTAAQTAMTWFKPPLQLPEAGLIRDFPSDPATLGRLGSLEVRLGTRVGDGAVIDHRFGTTDVLIVMPVAAINARYIEHFGVDATRHAA
jgi:putative hemolysin